MTTALPALPKLARPARVTFAGLVSSELLKLTSLRSSWLLGAASVGAGVIGAILQSNGTRLAVPTLLGAVVFSGMVIALLTAISGSSEYAHRTIQPSLMSSPDRLSFVASKSVAAAVCGAVLSLAAGILGVLVVGVPLDPELLGRLAACAGYGAAIGVFATLFGTLVRATAGTVAGIIGIVLLLPGLTGSIRLGDGYLSDWFFTEAGGALVVARSPGDVVTAVAVLVGWIVVGGVPALVRLLSRDA